MTTTSRLTTPGPRTPVPNTTVLSGYIETLTSIREEMARAAGSRRGALDAVHPDRRLSALNLVHYLALRRHDVRALQAGLASLGLSSLGRAEAHVHATIDAVLNVLHRLAGSSWTPEPVAAPDFATGDEVLAEQTRRLLGPASPGRDVRIMVTMSREAADDRALVHQLVQQGMNCMRINCAHDSIAEWERMIGHLRRAESALGTKCRVLMDLAGPKLRTGPIQAGPAVVKARPGRDARGEVTAPARIWLTDAEDPKPPPTAADAVLPVGRTWLERLEVDEEITFRDARGARRSLDVVDVTPDGCWAQSVKTAYFVPGMSLRRGGLSDGSGDRRTDVGAVAAREGRIRLMTGDTLILTRSLEPGRPASLDAAGRVLTPATVGCSMPQIFDDVQVGEPIWFDDGRLGGVIEQVSGDHLRVPITHTPPGGGTLRSDKGINLPDSQLGVPAISAKDVADLAFVAAHADMVALSFAASAADVEQLQAHIARLGARIPAIVLKIETERGFEHLPDMLLAAMKQPTCGVMIARGDLAVECGFERLAEVQEEMLWICEAAHVPVIWATQVLETLAKNGMASRAEITDAAMGHRAECVMLNKGPHILTAVRTLDDILRRMQAHQTKKRSMLRELRLAHRLA